MIHKERSALRICKCDGERRCKRDIRLRRRKEYDGYSLKLTPTYVYAVILLALTLLATSASAFVSPTAHRQRVSYGSRKEVLATRRRIRRSRVRQAAASPIPNDDDKEEIRHQSDHRNPQSSSVPRHVAFICDGNQRWAKKRHLPTILGHKKGADRLVDIIECFAAEDDNIQCIEHITLYGFSTENWKRSQREVREIFQVIEMTAQSLLRHEKKRQRPIQVRIVGDLDDERIPNGARQALRELEESTAKTVEKFHSKSNDADNDNQPSTLTVNLAINYGGRQDIVQACQQLAEQVAEGKLAANDISQDLISKHLHTANLPDPDMIIRTSGECRLSNFLLWDSAYTELYMTDTLWPDFDIKCWDQAAEWYSRRQRRFGARHDDHIESTDGDSAAASIQRVPNLRETSHSVNNSTTVVGAS